MKKCILSEGKQGRIHGNPVANGWAGAVMWKPLEINKVTRPKSRASALSEKSGRQTDEQTKTLKKTFELAVYL